MNIKLSQIIRLEDVLIKLSSEQFPVKVAYKIMKLMEEFDTHKEFYSKEFRKLLDTYAEKNDKGEIEQTEEGGVRISNDKMEEFQNEFSKLSDFEITIRDDYLLSFEEIENISLTPQQLSALEKFFVEN